MSDLFHEGCTKELTDAGWTLEIEGEEIWKSPNGALWKGTYQAWKIMRMRVRENEQ